MDFLGEILWYAIFVTPFITIPLAWRIIDFRKIYRLLIGIFSAAVLSFILYFFSLAIIFRNGMGPG